MKHFNGIAIPEKLGEILGHGRSCLVAWDVQNGLVNRVFDKTAFLERLGKLLEGLKGRMPVFYTRITPLPPDFQSPWGLYSAMRRAGVDDPGKIPPFMAPGSPEREICPAVAPAPGDIVLDKATADIFLGTNFEAMLRNKGISSILFTGIATEMGVETSARSASVRGFYPVVVSDCVSSADRAAHERSLANLARMVLVEDSKAVLKALETAIPAQLHVPTRA